MVLFGGGSKQAQAFDIGIARALLRRRWWCAKAGSADERGGFMALTRDFRQTVVERAKRDPTFKAQVDRAALVVLQAKQARGLLP